MVDMIHETQIDTSDDACMARGWAHARQWLAGLLALAGVAGIAVQAWPNALALPRSVRLRVLRKVRYLEALLRRLTCAMAAQVEWPDLPPGPRDPAFGGLIASAGTRRPLLVEHIVLPANGLGLARHWMPDQPGMAGQCEPEGAGNARKSVSPTIRLAEDWPDMSNDESHGRPIMTRPGHGPRILSLDAPFPHIEHDETVRSGDCAGRLLHRIRALQAVASDPARMVRRMVRWLARRQPRGRVDHRPTPLCIGSPSLAVEPEDRAMLQDIQHVARRMILRRDSS